MDPSILSALTRPGNIAFSSNRPCVTDLQTAGGRVTQQPSGHLIFYGPHGQRILATDPDGNPLHECDWVVSPDGAVKLTHARFRLDWGQWVGLKPEGLVNATRLDLSRKPGWERLRADDLRRMAAQALQVPFEEVRFFYGDEDLVIDRQGQATIRHKKDAFYVLEERTFDAPPQQVKFMACMGSMHWAKIDFLPVVELFQSLLPGTGSAAFELIRGLYDDQNPDSSQPLPLRYRGIPTYPSEAAYRLFGGFFLPQAPGRADPFPIFMDQSRSHEVTWLPAPDQPRRYFDPARNLCVTVKGDYMQKVTLLNDPAGLSYVPPGRNGFVPCERSLGVAGNMLVLKDGTQQTEIPLSSTWGRLRDLPPALVLASEGRGESEGWRALFGGRPPQVAAKQAFASVLLYPEDDREIAELPTQPFVADYLQDAIEQRPDLAASLARAKTVLIHNFDGALNACIRLDRPRDYRVLYQHPSFAQKQAQALWNQLAQAKKLDWVKRIVLLPEEDHRKNIYEQPYDLIYAWLPFSQLTHAQAVADAANRVATALQPRGLAFVVGLSSMAAILRASRLRIVEAAPVDQLPTFQMHKSILPRARVKPHLTVFQIVKG